MTAALCSAATQEVAPETKPETETHPEKEYPKKLTDSLYRVRRNWADGNCGQIAAFIYPMPAEAPTTDGEETCKIHKVVHGGYLMRHRKGMPR